MSEALAGPFKIAWGIIRPILAALWALINKVAGALGRIGGAIGKVGGFVGKTIGKIPGFRHGGVMPHTGLALLHRGETVIPSGAASAGSSISGDIILQVDGREFARIARDQLLRMKPSRGTLGLA